MIAAGPLHEGAIIAAPVMDQAIIVLSSFFGAAAVVSELMLAPLVALLAFAGLTILGITFQSRSLRKAHDDAATMLPAATWRCVRRPSTRVRDPPVNGPYKTFLRSLS